MTMIVRDEEANLPACLASDGRPCQINHPLARRSWEESLVVLRALHSQFPVAVFLGGGGMERFP